MVHTYTVGSYRMGYTLGVGTFGRVKLAMHEKTNQKVAVKIINRAKMQTMEMHEKISREISILQRLGPHPNIIRLYELLDTPTDIFMVMEYVPGGELFDYIIQKSRLQELEARAFFQQIISGVEYCHQHMICHRDLKPENVLLNTSLTVKVGDFGLSNFMRDGDYLKTSCGSPNYAAPEVVSGKAYAGPEVDVWSCGVILYALLCGSLPFDDEHVPNLFKKIKHGNFTLPGHLSENARRLIVRMLVVDPAARISLKEVRRHAWTKMPLSTNLWRPALNGVDDQVLEHLRSLGYTIDRETLVQYQRFSSGVYLPREVVAYNLLLDKKRQGRDTEESKEVPFAFSREVYKRVSAASVFHADYTPAGVMSFTASKDLFGIQPLRLRSIESKASGSKLGAESSGNLTTSEDQQQHPQPPARPLWRTQTSQILPQAPPKWKVGVESSLDAPTIMTATLHTLRTIGYEWSLVSQHKVWCRAKRAADGIVSDAPSGFNQVVLCIQVFRLFAGRAAVNVQVVDGSLALGMRAALSTLFAIYKTLAQAQQQSAGLTARSRKATT